jgi:hypothetical protein
MQDITDHTDVEPRNRHERRRLAADIPINDTATPAQPARLAYTIDELAAAIGGGGRSKLYAEIRAGKLKAKKLGSRTIITAPAAHAYLDALPDMAA